MDSIPTYPDLEGKVALVMGIGQKEDPDSNLWGNGSAIAYALSVNKATVFGCDINLAAAEFTKSRLPGPCEIMTGDVTSSSDVAKVVEACMKLHGRVDILINNVGMTAHGNAITMPEEVWDHQINLNLKSVYIVCNKVLPIMEKQGFGCVVNNASIAGIRYLGKPQLAYNSAKAAVVHFTQVTAATFASRGIRLNCVIPGMVLTPLIESLGKSEDPGNRETYKKITTHNVPMGRMGDAFDVANATIFLTSNAAKYITGHGLVVDGGLTVSTGT